MGESKSFLALVAHIDKAAWSEAIKLLHIHELRRLFFKSLSHNDAKHFGWKPYQYDTNIGGLYNHFWVL